MKNNRITEAIEMLGLQKLATVCGVTYQAVKKWEKRGRLPRTEWTGETSYATQIEKATDGRISRKQLISTPSAE
ncbi:hypothetical protein GZ77_09040 [Endozoicomonas montiporae]|uniref:Regulatory protein n=3 Tax=Endozoicomonas montiporae TaxID=1027273 RepID=A0A081N7R9_9GAMM|nr:regulatory protein from bacteriophage origin [Endozoicomonas montiporae CL-33]KEQ14492.1 hypothetical protein GZ77_09040 [Endozoicomonas montiporae]